jgi:hypothetical protein
MCNLLALENDFIQQTLQCYGSAQHCLDDQLRARKVYNQKEYSVVVVGGDRAKPTKNPSAKNSLYVMIRRRSDENKGQHFRQQSKGNKKGLFDTVTKKLPKVYLNGNAMYVDLEMQEETEQPLSSTAIRAKLDAIHNLNSDKQKSAALEELVSSNQIQASTAAYLLEHETSLYEKK